MRPSCLNVAGAALICPPSFSYTLAAELSLPDADGGALSLPLRVWPAPQPAAAAAGPVAPTEVLAWEDGDESPAAAAAAALAQTTGPPGEPPSPRMGASDLVSPLFGTPAPPQTPRAPTHSLARISTFSRSGGAAPPPTPRPQPKAAASPLDVPEGREQRRSLDGVAKSPVGSPAPGAARRGGAYSIRSREGAPPFVRVQLRGRGGDPAVGAGGELVGTLEFGADAGAPRCVHVAISLDTEERIAPAAAAGARASPAGHALRRVRDECAEVTAETALTSFAFSLPPDAPPSFQAGPLSHVWLLSFEFSLAAPGGGALELLRWALPVCVGPPAWRPLQDVV